MGDLITSYLDQRDATVGGTLPTVSFAEQALEGRGIDAIGGRVDLVLSIFENQGVPLAAGERAFLEDGVWIVRSENGDTQRLVDWDRARRGEE